MMLMPLSWTSAQQRGISPANIAKNHAGTEGRLAHCSAHPAAQCGRAVEFFFTAWLPPAISLFACLACTSHLFPVLAFKKSLGVVKLW